MARVLVVPDRSTVVVVARTSVGTITWRATDPEGELTCDVVDGAIGLATPPTGQLRLRVERLRSENPVYDAELMRRIDARRHPTTTVTLEGARAVGSRGRFEVRGSLDFHGVARPIDGVVAVEVGDEGLVVTGQKVIDVRDFGIPSPHNLLLQIYPTVRVHLMLELRPA